MADDEKAEHSFELVRGQNDDLNLTGAKINQQRDKVLFLESPAGGPHVQAQRVMLWNLKSNEISTVFDDYEKEQPKIKSLFALDVSSNYWLLDGEHVVLSTIHHSTELLVVLNVLTKALKVIDLPDLNEVNVLNLNNDLLALSCSSPDQPPVVLFGSVDMKRENPVQFKRLRAKQPSKNSKISYRIIRQNEDKPLEQVETILVGPAAVFDKPTPVIVIPHGRRFAGHCSVDHWNCSSKSLSNGQCPFQARPPNKSANSFSIVLIFSLSCLLFRTMQAVRTPPAWRCTTELRPSSSGSVSR